MKADASQVGAAESAVGAAEESVRFHSLDALRAFALLLGVVFHAAESFAPGVGAYWAVEDSSTSELLRLFRHACHSFRMEIFFLMAGFFARLLLLRRGLRGFVRNRVSRILVPFVAGWLVLYPLLVYLWILGMSLTGRLSILGVPAELAGTPSSLLTLGFFAKGGFVSRFDLTHLWFLHQLLVVYAFFLLLRWGWRRALGEAGSWRAGLDRRFAALCSSRWSVFVLAGLTVPMLMLMDSGGVDTPKSSLLPHLPTTLLFGFMFSLGWLLHRQPELLELPARRWRVHLLIGAMLVLPTGWGLHWVHQWGVESPGIGLRWASSILYALMMWGFVLGFLGLFVRHRRNPSVRWRYIADASYWVYLVHLPVVVGLQIVVCRWPWPWGLKYPLILVVSVPLLFLSYHYLARSTFIGAQLNGRRYSIRNCPAR